MIGKDARLLAWISRPGWELDCIPGEHTAKGQGNEQDHKGNTAIQRSTNNGELAMVEASVSELEVETRKSTDEHTREETVCVVTDGIPCLLLMKCFWFVSRLCQRPNLVGRGGRQTHKYEDRHVEILCKIEAADARNNLGEEEPGGRETDTDQEAHWHKEVPIRTVYFSGQGPRKGFLILCRVSWKSAFFEKSGKAAR